MHTPADQFGLTRAWEWHHSGIVVTDLDAAIDFYSQNFGYALEFEVRAMTDLFQRTVGVPGIECDLAQLVGPLAPVRLELIAVRGVPGGLNPALPVHVGVGHHAYVVDDLAVAIQSVIASGGSLIGEVVDFEEGPAAYCWTPAGTVVELEARHRPHTNEEK